MTFSPGPPARPRDGADSVRAAWSSAPYPVLVVDRGGGVVDINDAARVLLPTAADGERLDRTAPGWLVDAHRRLSRDGADPRSVRPASGAIADRTFEAHPTSGAGDDGDIVWWLVEDTDLRLTERALHSQRQRAAVLADISGALLSSLNVERCMEVTARMAAEHIGDAAVIVAPAQGRRYPMTYAQNGGPVTQATALIDPADVPGLAEALQGFPPVPARWISPDDIPDWAIPPGFTGPIGSVIITSLPGHGVPAGALILLRSSSHRAFTEGEELFARLFAARAGAALSAARLYAEQTSITTVLMQELLPPSLRNVHGVGYAGRYRAAGDHERVGGDFYDVHPGADPSQESLVVLGDVAGKGLEAAVLTGKIRSVLQALLPLAGDHQQVLTLLNDALLTSHHTRFATLVLVSARRRAGQVHLRITSAGHMPPLIVRRDGHVEEADTGGQLIGAMPQVTARTARVVLAPGETCLLYTDGITEARGGPLGDQLYGEPRLRHMLGECARMPAEAVVERVQMLAANWLAGARHDDIATLAITNPTSSRGTLHLVDDHTPAPAAAPPTAPVPRQGGPADRDRTDRDRTDRERADGDRPDEEPAHQEPADRERADREGDRA
ncbi:SpoIIE family protein phosphatase [Streptomyces sp. NPDC058219]|uniref:SpoIIE family protein phosphatase n=1 Tax=unclassified Streptomyces TaxID=2593676 RepID=UPI00364E307E